MADGASLAVVGVSVSRICGAHDHATLLAQELERDEYACTMHWLSRTPAPLRDARTEMRAWARSLGEQLDAERPDAVLLHYSVFSYSHRGLPVLLGPVVSSLRRRPAPVVAIMHELAYAWFLGGVRGKTWALTQRLALIDLVRACAGVLVTTDRRAAWLSSRRWLPRRAVAFAPVFSNLPAPAARPAPGPHAPLVGLFGYSYEGAESTIVLDALRSLRERHGDARLLLLGSPGESSAPGRAWVASARERGIEDAVSFSGTLPAQELSDALARCDVLISAFSSGPSSRKGTLAGMLASGRPVVALEGPRGWQELERSGAIALAAPAPEPLADALAALLDDPARREQLGALGREFAEQRMGVARTAQAVEGLLAQALARG